MEKRWKKRWRSGDVGETENVCGKTVVATLEIWRSGDVGEAENVCGKKVEQTLEIWRSLKMCRVLWR